MPSTKFDYVPTGDTDTDLARLNYLADRQAKLGDKEFEKGYHCMGYVCRTVERHYRALAAELTQK